MAPRPMRLSASDDDGAYALYGALSYCSWYGEGDAVRRAGGMAAAARAVDEEMDGA